MILTLKMMIFDQTLTPKIITFDHFLRPPDHQSLASYGFMIRSRQGLIQTWLKTDQN